MTNDSMSHVAAPAGDPPIACTLGAGEIAGRVDDWRRVLDHETSRVSTEERDLRISFDDQIEFESLARLVAAEQHCCAFFSFKLEIGAGGIALEVGAPRDATPMIEELFGPIPA